MRTRRNVWTLPGGDETLAWYARAVAAMKQRPLGDPLGWRYQGAIHGYPGREHDPYWKGGDKLPAGRKTYWDQCQHQTAFFLPWHRMYLFHFERIVAAHVAALGGPADWALPYWNYAGGDASRALPVAFRSPADEATNPLFVGARSPRANALEGAPALEEEDVYLGDCLNAPNEGPTGFFGPDPRNHGGGAPFGALEGTPHGNVHVKVGAIIPDDDVWNDGWMYNPDLAALDPIFWLHHANIDRLWEVWLRRDPAHRNPGSALWLKGETFAFHDANGKPVKMVAADVLDTRAPPLEYEYDDVADPLAPGPAPAAAGPLVHELVGATTESVGITPGVVHADLPTPVTPEAFATARGRPARTAPQHVMLRLEHVISRSAAPQLDVYLDLPGGDPHGDFLVSRLSLFGVQQASRAASRHGGSGLTYEIDVTDSYGRLRARPGFDPARLRVTFRTVGGRPTSRVKVGRVSLYFA